MALAPACSARSAATTGAEVLHRCQPARPPAALKAGVPREQQTAAALWIVGLNPISAPPMLFSECV